MSLLNDQLDQGNRLFEGEATFQLQAPNLATAESMMDKAVDVLEQAGFVVTNYGAEPSHPECWNSYGAVNVVPPTRPEDVKVEPE